MPARIARSNAVQPIKKQSSKKNKKRHLDAFAIAGKIAPEKTKIRNHRFGEIEEEPQRSKRRRDDDEDDDEEDVEHERQKRRRQESGNDDVEFGSDSEGNEWVTGEVNDDDDESLDSDEAFGESDEERFEGFTFRGSSAGGQKPKKARQAVEDEDELNLDEGEGEEEEDDFGDEGVDLATMLDDENEDEEEDEAEDADSESEDSDEDMLAEDDDDEKHARLQDFVENLNASSKTKSHTEANEDELTLEDLLAGADIDNKTLAALRPKRKSRAAELVKPNLPKRQQDAIDRKLATTKAKEQLDRWQDSVIANRRSDFLQFPLRNPDQTEPTNKDTFVPAEQTAPSTELEANIKQIMEESGMLAKDIGAQDIDDGLLKAEAMEANKIPVEEMLARRAKLRQMRILLDREERKAKRVAKIKSKDYRRVHRKEKQRLADKARQLLDPEAYANGELNEDEQEEADRRRAEARMDTKHRNSNWAKSLRATDRAKWDDDARAGVIEQARRQEELRRRIAGRDVSDDDDGDDDDDDLPVPEQLARLAKPDDTEKKGLAALAFMQKAENRRKAENDAAIAELQRDLDPEAEELSGIEDNGLGRAIFGPKREVAKATKAKVQRHTLEEGPPSDDEDSSQEQAAANASKQPASGTQLKSKPKSGSGPLSKIPSKPPAEEPVQTTTTSSWLVKGDKKSKSNRRQATDSNNDDPLPAVSTAATEKNVANTDGWTTVSYAQDEQDNDDDETTTEKPILDKASREAALKARVFAGDDVAVQFAAEKEELMASEDEKESSSYMPGWGSWAGAGLSKAAKRAAERARHNPLYKTKTAGTRPQNRKDAKLENVIISEKSDRKGKKYLAPILPHQFERKEEYERSLRMPLGPEWTTKEVFQKNTRPRVVVKPGTVIEPMSRPLV